ncbi:MAG TPA: hydroxymethylglutaryl-CoA reductase [Terriglobales bacterium]|nr:hydroxymethylglutaryl-CoA reductase [Terriglobales bacterium]
MAPAISEKEVLGLLHSRRSVPRDRVNDYTTDCADKRRKFLEDVAQVELNHVASYSFSPSVVRGNIENFIGVAQVPIGVAGPLTIHGEYAQGEFYVPLATTEGALVASYNRGMRLLSACGGIKTTVVDDAMQRAPVFSFSDAVEAREFGVWIDEHLEEIRKKAEETTRIGRLKSINQFAVGPLRFLRFNYSTGDAAGQNMSSKATYAACEWIQRNYPRKCEYFLTGNIDTDKKHSHINVLSGRGKRVVAEAILQRDLLHKYLHIDIADLARMREVQMTGAFLAGASSNCAHAANGLAALFIATGQDAANIAESHAAITYTRSLPDGNFYWSITLPSLIVATYGGGTGLATQRQCLELLGCYGAGKVQKFAEICAAVVLAGETSLVGAIVHGDWVTAHENLGRNRR